MKTISFRNYDMYWDIAVDIHFPPDFDEAKNIPPLSVRIQLVVAKSKRRGAFMGRH